MPSPLNDSTTPLLSAVKKTRVRLLLGDALQRMALFLPLPLIYLILTLAYIKLGHPPEQTTRWLLWAALIPTAAVLVSVIAVLIRGPNELFAAVLLDRVHGLRGRVANAISFLAAERQAPMEACAVEDAARFVPQLSPATAAPIAFPRRLWWSALLTVVLFGLSTIEVRHARIVTSPAPGSSFTPFTLAEDDQTFLEEEARRLAESASDPEVVAVVNKFNRLVEDLARGRLDRKQALQQMDALQRALEQGSALDREALEDSLRQLGESLAKNSLTKAAADALKEQRLPDAEEALRKLAERLKRKPAGLSKQELEKLRTALEAASRGNQERLERIESQRQNAQQERKRLLKKKEQSQSDKQNSNVEQAVKKQERELKRLERQKRKAESAARQMSELDRQLAQAAQELMNELGEAAKSLESGAESLNRARQKQLSDAEKEALKKQLQELKELLRQAKSGNKERQKQLERFRKRAQGGKPGDKDPSQGSGQGKPQLKLGGGGQGGGIDLPVPGQSSAQGSGQAGAGGKGEAAGAAAGGEVRGEPTDLKGKTQDVAAAGIDSGQGTASSEVVYGAASRGFTAGGYRKVFTDYKTVAEEVLESDEIPAGYKFYVRRYFQLIRPRD